MTSIAIVLAAWLVLSVPAALLLARMFLFPSSLGGTPPTAAVEGMARPDEAAVVPTALPGASRNFSLPADSVPGSESASPASQQRDGAFVTAGDASNVPEPHSGPGPL